MTTHKSNPKNENQIQFSFESIDLSASEKITLDVKRPHLTSTKLQYMAHDTHETQSTAILHADDNEPPFKQNWSYYSLIGKLNFPALNSSTDICFAIHQCTQWCPNT